MRKLVLALFVAAALAFPKTVSERLAELEQKVKVHELEQRVASLQTGTVKEASCQVERKLECMQICDRRFEYRQNNFDRDGHRACVDDCENCQM